MPIVPIFCHLLGPLEHDLRGYLFPTMHTYLEDSQYCGLLNQTQRTVDENM